MNSKFIVGMFVAMAFLSLAAAYDVNTPYTTSMRWIIGSDTTFSVALCGSETSIDFDTNIVNPNSKAVEPDCQNAGGNTPIATITNNGNVAQNFTGNLTASKPSFAVLYLNNNSVFGTARQFDTTAVLIQDNVAASASAKLYLWTNLTSASAGTTTRTFQINGGQA